MIDRTFILALDRDLMEQDVPLYARPFHIVSEWMRINGIEGDWLASEIWEPLMAEYKTLYSSGDFALPSMAVGGVAFRDKMYLARVNMAYGSASIVPLNLIEIPATELEIIFHSYPDEIWRGIYSVADLVDFSFGIDDLKGQVIDADELWNNARAAIAATARTLAGDQDYDSAVQSACLAAELAMKGCLAFLGWSEGQRRKAGHRLIDLAEAIIASKPTLNDGRLRLACAGFPDYVQTRYKPHCLTKLQMLTLGMRSQFVAAEALRHISLRDFGATVEASSDSKPWRPL